MIKRVVGSGRSPAVPGVALLSVALVVSGISALPAISSAGETPAGQPGGTPPETPPRLPHPAIPLLDAEGANVATSGAPVSTRRSCGGCHDVDFIADSFHFQQGKNEMDPALLAAHGIAAFNSSPGMFGKFSIIPNRQLTRLGITSEADYDMSQPYWLTKCGVCHTGGGISEFDLEGRRLSAHNRPAGPLDPSYTTRNAKGEIVAWDWEKSGVAEADCFLCHVPKANRGARREAMAAGNFRWANNATLVGSGIVTSLEEGRYAYDPMAFDAAGNVRPELLGLADPRLENCAQCHGFTARNATTIQPIQFSDIMRGTEKAGWIFNGAKISDTVSPTIVGKEAMDFPWDVHAARDMTCIDCHFSPNNPGRMIQSDPAKNLRFRPREADIAVYLKRPDHNFARGNIPPETVNMTRHNTMRGCSECHDTARTHDFLPHKELHFRALACQTCHIPAVHFWAYRSDEWGFLMDSGTSRITFRGIDGDIANPDARVTGFLPAYIPTKDARGVLQIRPTNLITGVYWFDRSKARPAFSWQVQKALFSGREEDGTWVYRPEVITAFGDQDGFIDRPQAVYDTPQKLELARDLVKEHGGIPDPELRIEIVPWAMSHSIADKDQAVRDCTACHSSASMLHRPVDLADTLPKDVPVYYAGARHDLVRFTEAGPVFDNHELLSSFYIIGCTRVPWIEWVGWFSVLAAIVFALVHGALRLVGGK